MKKQTKKPTTRPTTLPTVAPQGAKAGAVAMVEPVKVALTDDQAANAIRQQYQIVLKAEEASFWARARLGAMLLQWEAFLGEARGGKGGGAGEGLKGWLEKNCPELGYESALSYKNSARMAATMIGGGAVAVAALLGESEVTQPDGEVIDVPCEVVEKRDKLYKDVKSRRKLEQAYFAFMAGDGKPGKKRSKGLDVGGEAAAVLTAAQTAHAEWSRLLVLAPRFAKMVRLAASLTRRDATDAIELLRPLMDALRARVKEG